LLTLPWGAAQAAISLAVMAWMLAAPLAAIQLLPGR
jgi:hypothetical protein